MAEVNGAHKHGKYERIWLKSLCILSNIRLLDRQAANQHRNKPSSKFVPHKTDVLTEKSQPKHLITQIKNKYDFNSVKMNAGLYLCTKDTQYVSCDKCLGSRT